MRSGSATAVDGIVLVEGISIGAFVVGIPAGLWLACSQDLPRPDDDMVPSIQDFLQASPVLLWTFAILGAVWVALRTAAKVQRSVAKELAEDDNPKSERVASAMAWADIEAIVSLGGSGVTIGVMVAMANVSGRGCLIALILGIALGVTLGAMKCLKRYHIRVAERRERAS